MSFDGLVASDEGFSNHGLISLAMYGTPEAPLYAAIWLPSSFGASENWPVRKRTFELDWNFHTIYTHRQFDRFPTLVGITGGTFDTPRSILVFEKVLMKPGESAPTIAPPDVVKTEKPSTFFEKYRGRVITGLDMCIQYFENPPNNPFAASPAPSKKATYVAVIAAKLTSPKTLFNVMLLDPVQDNIDGINDADQHAATLQGWSRGHHAVPTHKNKSGKRQVLVHYRDDTFAKWPGNMKDPFDGGTPIEGPIKPSQLPSRLSAAEARGQWPIQIGANGSGSDVRFCVTWAKEGRVYPNQRHDVVVDGVGREQKRVLQQTNTVTGFSVGSSSSSPVVTQGGAGGGPPADPVAAKIASHLAQIDKLIFDTMHNSGSHAAQVVIAKDSRLKLVRSYTFGEWGYPVTNAHHLFRMGSIAKMLCAMRAVAFDDANWLKSSIAEHFTSLHPDTPDDRAQKFQNTRVIDLLRFQSGWQPDRGDPKYLYATDVFEKRALRSDENDGVRRLPLKPGDFGLFVKGSKLDFVQHNPRTIESYNNYEYWAAGELVSLRHYPTFYGRYVGAMHEFWGGGDAAGIGQLAPSLLASRRDSLDAGEVVTRTVPAFKRATLTGDNDFPQADGGVANWVAGAYRHGRDAEAAAGYGYFTMSAVMLARIMQGMHPDPIAPVVSLLTPTQIEWLATPNPNALATSKGVTFPSETGLGTSQKERSFAGHGALNLSKGGSMPGLQADSHLDHFIWQDGRGAPHSLTAISVINGEVVHIDGQAEALEKLGHWDDDTNLFPEFFE